MCKRLFIFIFVFIMFVANIKCDTSAATFNDINSANMFFKQNTSTTCTLASAAMLVRRAALMNGNSAWSSVTEANMRSAAWTTGGLKNSFSYAGINVSSGKLSGSKTQTVINLLSQHPEGIVLYNFSKPHAILVTDYTNGTFYCADPSGAAPGGRIPISQATITVESGDKYWYVSSPRVGLNTEKPSVGSVHIDTEDGKVHYYCNVSTGAGASTANVNITTDTGKSRNYTLPISNGMVDGYIHWTDFMSEEAVYTIMISLTDISGNIASNSASIDAKSEMSVTPTSSITLKVGESYQFTSHVKGLFHINSISWDVYKRSRDRITITDNGLVTAILPGKYMFDCNINFTKYNGDGTPATVGICSIPREVNVELPTPSIKTLTADTKGNINLSIQEAAGADRYEIIGKEYINGFEYDEIHDVTNAEDISKIYSGLEDGHEWRYKIRACRTIEEETYYSDWSSEMSIVAMNLKTKILSSENEKSGEIGIYWEPVQSAEGYLIYRSNGIDEKLLTIADKDTTCYTDSTVKEGNIYTYKVVPYLGVEFGETENPVTVTAKEIKSETEKLVPGSGKGGENNKNTIPSVSKVKKFKAKAGKNKLKLSWKKLSGISGYQIQISKKKNFKDAKIISVSESKKKYTRKNLQANKKYYIRIRAYKTYPDVQGYIQKAYGKWTKSSKKTK